MVKVLNFPSKAVQTGPVSPLVYAAVGICMLNLGTLRISSGLTEF